jgi:Zn-dependent protease with chaperone function
MTGGRSHGSVCSRRSSWRRSPRRCSSWACRASGSTCTLAEALETLDRDAKALPMPVNPATASLYIANPLPRTGVATLFSTHPPIAERVRRLRSYDGSVLIAHAV